MLLHNYLLSFVVSFSFWLLKDYRGGSICSLNLSASFHLTLLLLLPSYDTYVMPIICAWKLHNSLRSTKVTHEDQKCERRCAKRNKSFNDKRLIKNIAVLGYDERDIRRLAEKTECRTAKNVFSEASVKDCCRFSKITAPFIQNFTSHHCSSKGYRMTKKLRTLTCNALEQKNVWYVNVFIFMLYINYLSQALAEL